MFPILPPSLACRLPRPTRVVDDPGELFEADPRLSPAPAPPNMAFQLSLSIHLCLSVPYTPHPLLLYLAPQVVSTLASSSRRTPAFSSDSSQYSLPAFPMHIPIPICSSPSLACSLPRPTSVVDPSELFDANPGCRQRPFQLLARGTWAQRGVRLLFSFVRRALGYRGTGESYVIIIRAG